MEEINIADLIKSEQMITTDISQKKTETWPINT